MCQPPCWTENKSTPLSDWSLWFSARGTNSTLAWVCAPFCAHSQQKGELQFSFCHYVLLCFSRLWGLHSGLLNPSCPPLRQLFASKHTVMECLLLPPHLIFATRDVDSLDLPWPTHWPALPAQAVSKLSGGSEFAGLRLPATVLDLIFFFFHSIWHCLLLLFFPYNVRWGTWVSAQLQQFPWGLSKGQKEEAKTEVFRLHGLEPLQSSETVLTPGRVRPSPFSSLFSVFPSSIIYSFWAVCGEEGGPGKRGCGEGLCILHMCSLWLSHVWTCGLPAWPSRKQEVEPEAGIPHSAWFSLEH